ncbi:hypothetical protein MMC25_007856 [Agyrium rufum]|nr:hypothetical protein [Agyrium rufum]
MDVSLSTRCSIYYPVRPTSSNPTILYLPHGTVQNLLADDRACSSLVLGANATVVKLTYRHSSKNPYPGPIHDTLAGYDWVVKHLLRGAGSQNARQALSSKQRLGVCGEVIGGSLATMLALTECHAYKVGVGALAVGNPVTDWTAMHVDPNSALKTRNVVHEEQLEKVKKARKNPESDNSFLEFAADPQLPASALLLLRSTMFTKAERYFDPFGSPLLFFRTPSSELPSDYDGNGLDEVKISFEEMMGVYQWARKRRAHRRYPPSSAPGLRIPNTLIEIGEENVLRDQGWDLVDAMRRSVELYEDDRRDNRGVVMTGVESQDERARRALGRVQMRMKTGVGMWSEDDLVNVGRWFAEHL